MSSITERLSEFAASLDYDQIPSEVSTRAKQLLLDITGISLRGLNDTESTEPMRKTLARLGLASGDSIVIGDAGGYAPTAAALLNGASAHSLDFDDTHAAGSIHSSAPIVPAALAAAQMANAQRKGLSGGYCRGL